MKITAKDARGFSALGLVLVLAIVGIIGAVGVTVFRAQNASDQAKDGNSGVAKSGESKSSANQLVLVAEGVQKPSDDVPTQYMRKLNFTTLKLEEYSDGLLSASPDGKKLLKSAGGVISVADAKKPKDFNQVFPTSAKEKAISAAAIWADDSKRIIVTTSENTAPTDSVPKMYEVVYTVDLKDGKARKLFDHTEVYGGITVTGTDVSKDVLYWRTDGDGGFRDRLNVSSLSTGAAISKFGDATDVGGEISKVIDGVSYYESSDSTFRSRLMAYDIKARTSTALYDTGATPAETEADGQRSPGFSIYANGIIPGSKPDTIIFSQTAWSKGKSTTTVFEINVKSKEKRELFVKKDHPFDYEITPLALTAEGLVATASPHSVGLNDVKTVALVFIKDGKLTVVAESPSGRYGPVTIAEM